MIGRELTMDEARAVLATLAGPAAGGAIVLVLAEPLRVAWANAAAVALFGTTDPAGLHAQLFAGQGRDGLGPHVLDRVPVGGASQTARLRLFRGFRSRTVTAALSRAALPDGEEVIALCMPAVVQGEAAETGRDALRRLPKEPPPDDRPAAAKAVAAPGLRRFLWRTDAAHRLSGTLEGADELAEPVRDAGGFAQALAALGIAADPLRDALGAEASFSGLRLDWPLASGPARRPVALGGIPVRDEDDRFLGFRGYGVADFRRAADAAAVDATPPSSREPPAVARPLQADEPGAADAEPPPTAPMEPPAPASVEAPAASPPPLRPSTGVRASFSSAKIVALRPHKVTGAAADGRPGVTTNLSPDEQFNLDEIARALKGVDVETPRREAPDSSAAILAALPVPILVECKGRIVYANTAFLDLTGFASARAVDRAGGRPHLLGGLEAAQVAGVAEDKAFPIIDASGGVLSVEGRVAVIEWGGAAAEMLTLRPTSDRVAEIHALQAEARRRQSEARDARALLDRVSDAIAIADSHGRLLAVSDVTERLFGRDRNSLIGESIGVLLTPEGQSAALGAIFAAVTAGPDAEDAELAATGRRADATLLTLRLRLRALDAGRIGIVLRDDGVVQDLREETGRLRAEVNQAGAARSAFLAKVSHEIRTPLSAITGFAEVMLDERLGPLGNDRYRDYLGDILASGRRVIDLVADLSSLSAVQAGEHTPTLAATDVNRTITDLVAGLQEEAHRDRVIVRLSLAPRLPSALVDAEALRQVMSNLLSNAIRFNEPGGQVIVSTAVTEAGGIAVRVRDTGIGMTEAELAVAMEPFRQISIGRPGGGAGLGLPLARALVEANNATLAIHSRKGEGTLVEVVLRQMGDRTMSVPAA